MNLLSALLALSPVLVLLLLLVLRRMPADVAGLDGWLTSVQGSVILAVLIS